MVRVFKLVESTGLIFVQYTTDNNSIINSLQIRENLTLIVMLHHFANVQYIQYKYTDLLRNMC